jgi:photosystem II stability/assembly factor-like uncharacterized protein
MRNFLTILACLVISPGCNLFSQPQRGEVVETWETMNKTFKVRVTAYSEKGAYPSVGGGYYLFQSALVGSDKWSEIMTFRHDDPIAIPREQVRFLNDQVGYVFMVYKYAVTTDGGTTWSVWNVVEDLPDWPRTRAAIKEIQLTADGAGKMTLTSFTNSKSPELQTKDYGRHWSVE